MTEGSAAQAKAFFYYLNALTLTEIRVYVAATLVDSRERRVFDALTKGMSRDELLDAAAQVLGAQKIQADRKLFAASSIPPPPPVPKGLAADEPEPSGIRRASSRPTVVLSSERSPGLYALILSRHGGSVRFGVDE